MSKHLSEKVFEQNLKKFSKHLTDGTSITMGNSSGFRKGMEIQITGPQKTERVIISDVSLPTYKHKSWFHKLIFDLTSKFLLCGWPQPKIINGGTLTIKRPNKYIITEVWKTGEKILKYKGKKLQGYNIYCNDSFKEFLPYGNEPTL